MKVEVSHQREFPGRVFVVAQTAFATTAQARQMAYALLTAADEADRRVSDVQ
jgi:hypothetical protein